jgi:hypothetical protein
MKITETQKQALLLEIHQSIENTAKQVIESLSLGKSPILSYPPNSHLTTEEETSLTEIKSNKILQNALRKIITDAAQAPFFHFFCLLDGVSNPEYIKEKWLGCELHQVTGREEQTEFLHDELFETYWTWQQKRSEPVK